MKFLMTKHRGVNAKWFYLLLCSTALRTFSLSSLALDNCFTTVTNKNGQEMMIFCFFIGVVVNVYRLHSIKEIRHLLGLFWGELYWHIEPNLSFKIIITHIL